jgi:DNA-binding NarL/FixJ family response regulator
MKTIKSSTYNLNPRDLDLKTLVTLVAEGYVESDIAIVLMARASNVDEGALANALRKVPKAVRKATKWTVEEEQIIIKMWNEGKTARQIGEIMGRTAGSVGLRINHLRSAGHELVSHEAGRRKQA